MRVEEVMTGSVRHCAPETNLEAAIEIMGSNFGGELLVVEGGRVLGILTERDICLALGAGNRAARDVVVRDVRITVVQTCQPDDDVGSGDGFHAGGQSTAGACREQTGNSAGQRDSERFDPSDRAGTRNNKVEQIPRDARLSSASIRSVTLSGRSKQRSLTRRLLRDPVNVLRTGCVMTPMLGLNTSFASKRRIGCYGEPKT